MNSYKKIAAALAVSALSLPFFNLSAQTPGSDFQRVSVGYNATLGSHDTTLNGFVAEYTYGFNIQDKPMFVEAGAGVQYGSGDDLTLWTVKIPVNFSYAIPVSSSVTLSPFAGVNFKINASGKYDLGEGYEINIFDNDGFDGNRFQMGWQLGLGATFNRHFFASLQYGTDFIKLADHLSTADISLKIGYTF